MAMKPRYKVEFSAFSPAEVEAITGLNTGLQRLWRRRGILPLKPDSGHSRFQPVELARIVVLMAIRDLIDSKVETAADHADRVAEVVLSYALQYPESRRFDGTMVDKKEFEKEFNRQANEGKEFFDAYLDLPEGDDHYYSVYHSGKWEMTGTVEDIFNMENDHDEGGIVVNLFVLGRKLAEKITRPLVVVKLAPPRRGG
jgi:hypothetical protein